EALSEAAAGYRRIEAFVLRVLDDAVGGDVTRVSGGEVTDGFAAALDDDLGVPAALAEIHGRVRAGNTALAEGDSEAAVAIAAQVRAMTDVLGVDPLDSHWGSGGGAEDRAMSALDSLVTADLATRAEA